MTHCYVIRTLPLLFPSQCCKVLLSHSPLVFQAVLYIMSRLNNNCQKNKQFGFTDVWYNSKSIAFYAQILLIVLIALPHQQSNDCAKYNMKTLSVASAYSYGVPCFVFCQFCHQGGDESSCLLHMLVVFKLKNLEVYVGVEPCHCQNVFFYVLVLGTTVSLVFQLTPPVHALMGWNWLFFYVI